jgi:hypothetical protein
LSFLKAKKHNQKDLANIAGSFFVHQKNYQKRRITMVTHLIPACWTGPADSDLPKQKPKSSIQHQCVQCKTIIKNLHRNTTHRNSNNELCPCRSFEEVNL